MGSLSVAYSDIPLWERPFERGSYLLNFIYWKFPHNISFDYLKYLHTMFSDSVVLSDHLSSLKKFIDYSKVHNTPMYVLIFPFFHDLETSRIFATPVKDFFKLKKYP